MGAGTAWKHLGSLVRACWGMNLSFDQRASHPLQQGARVCYPTAAPSPEPATTAASFRPQNSQHMALVIPEPSDRYKHARDPGAQIRQAIQESCMQCGGSSASLWRSRFSRHQTETLCYADFCDKVPLSWCTCGAISCVRRSRDLGVGFSSPQEMLRL